MYRYTIHESRYLRQARLLSHYVDIATLSATTPSQEFSVVALYFSKSSFICQFKNYKLFLN